MSTDLHPVSSVPKPKPEPKKWSVGTLCYTSGGLVILFVWLLWGDFACTMKDRAITPTVQIMLRGFSSPDWLVGLLVGSLPSAIGMFLAPIISVKSDRYRSRIGRRIPFLLFPTPIIVICMFGLAVTPSVGDWLHAFLGESAPSLMFCRIAVFSCFWTLFEIAATIVNSLFGALINDVVPTVLIGRFFALFRAVSLIAGVIFNYYLMGKVSTSSFEIFVGLGLLYGVGFTIMCLKVKEGSYAPVLQAGESTEKGAVSPVRYFKECFGNSYYLWFFAATTLGGLALCPVNTFSVFHSRSLNMSDDLYGKSLALSYACSFVIAYPIGIIADRFHPLRVAIAGMVLYSLVTGFGYIFANGIWTFFAAFVLHTIVAGVYLTGTASLGQRLLPNSKFAQYASAGGLVGSISYMILPPLLGVFIQSMNHEYRYVFLLAGITAIASALSYFVVYRRFQGLGGDRDYIAPLGSPE